jgi:hypothetical protein
VFRNTAANIIVILILSGCSGGLSGIMSSSGAGHWLIYKVSLNAETEINFVQPTEQVLEAMLLNLGYEKAFDWGEPFLINAQVAKFKQKYKNQYISLDVQISEKDIIIMSTSYSSVTEKVFNKLELALNEKFTGFDIDKCFETKHIYGHSCFK